MPRIQTKNIQALLAKLDKLEIENRRLRNELEFLRGHPTIAKGLKGEVLVSDLISAKLSRRGAGHDLESYEGRLLVEVKYSSLLSPKRNHPIKTWVWTKIFGELGKKQFHRLLLVGDADPRFVASYVDTMSPYIIFDLSFEDAIECTGGVKPGRHGRIQLTTNPLTVRSHRAKMLFGDYQVSIAELKHRYPALNSM